MAAPDTIIQAQGLNSVASANLLVTPTGGAQGKLGDLLKSGQGTSGPVAATTLSASGAVTLSPASANIVLSPTGTGVVTLNPATAGTMDNVALGVTTPLAVHATTLSATGAVSLTNASVSMTAIPTADPHVIGRVWANAGVLTISAG